MIILGKFLPKSLKIYFPVAYLSKVETLNLTFRLDDRNTYNPYYVKYQFSIKLDNELK